MRSVFFIGAFLIAFAGFAQKNKIGLTVSPGTAYRVYEAKRDDGLVWGKNQTPKFGYSITASYERDFYKRASFFTGLSFINDGYQMERSDLRFSDQILPKRGFVPPSADAYPYHSFRYRYSYYQIGIPVGVNYFMPYKKIKFFFSAGASANYLINVRYRFILYADKGKNGGSVRDDNADFYKNFNFSAFASFGVALNLNANYTLRIAPTFRQTFTNVMDDRIIYRIYPNAASIGFGVYRQL